MLFRKIKTLINYLSECYSVIKQGKGFKSKWTLIKYFSKIPLFVTQSIITGKDFREIENKYKQLPNRVVLQNNDGVFDCGNSMATVYLIVNEYEAHFEKFMHLEEGVFLDIGAHIGKYTIKVANQLNGNGHVYSFEPEKHNFSLLEKNVERNGLMNVHLINKGLYETKGELPFYVCEKGEGIHSIHERQESLEEKTITVTTIDDFVNEYGVERVDCIKIDTERAEFEVLKGGENTLRKYKPRLIVEIGEENFEKTHAYIQSIGYNSFTPIDYENFCYKYDKTKMNDAIELFYPFPRGTKMDPNELGID